MELCRKIRQVDIAGPLALLPSVEFHDTGGSNGCIASPSWLPEFVESLNLGRVELALLRNLPPGRNIPPHIDTVRGRGNRGHRYHVPFVTHPLAVMRWPDDGYETHLEAGWLYEVDYTRLHEVVQASPVDRVHLMVVAHA